MGRRTSKAGHDAGVAPGYETVGMTILPGHPLPEWAAQVPVESAGPEFPAAQVQAPVADATTAAQAPAPAADEPAPDLSHALVGAGVGAGMGAAAQVRTDVAQGGLADPGPLGAGYAGAGYSPAAGTGGMGTPPGAGLPAAGYPASHAPAGGVAGHAPGRPTGYGASAAYGASGSTATAPMAPAGSPFAPPAPRAPESHGGGTGTHQASVEGHPGAMSTATVDAPAPPDSAAPAGTAADAAAPATPSAGWASPDRPELSPEHVALLTWWADMMAKGQFPAPPGAPGAPPAPPARESRRRRGRKAAPGAAPSHRRTTLVAVGLGGVAAVGLAVAFGPGLVASFTEEPAPTPATNLTMPTSVGELVAVSTPDVSQQLQSMLGLGLRPAGITTTAGYGTDPAGPVVLAGLATTTPADADAAGQIATWAARMGATVGAPVAGGPGTGGITCAEVTAIPDALPGSFCVWTGSDRRGQSYVVGAGPEAALEPTAQLREGVVATP